ncbi:MAG: alpha/beta fold hydrolase [Candidatus Sericytochromatia bacterium]|uniref:Alpha/beta fold hydrolase n=1 Tax=Candidatus Tanganyikabacteria bacterium TaxID=2961651 RepID=A0A938BK18_9BACT|nr:alpha/beta fold hydrolase [Candidatus Tanganyikabacteria bacterium]
MAISAVGAGARLSGFARTPVVRRDGAPDDRAKLGAPPDLVTYRKGLAALEAAIEAEKALPLQKGSESRLLAHPTPPPKGTIVMLHGFSAGTWQFDDLAKRFFDEGYNVYVPRMPGHGFKLPGGEEDAAKLLDSRTWRNYHAFAADVYSRTKGLGGPMHLMGLSGGANVALDIALHHPDVKGAVLCAPFLAPRSNSARFALGAVRVLDFFTFGLFGRILDQVAFGWGEDGRAASRAWGRPGHWDMKMGNVYGLYRHGQTLVSEAAKIKVPLQFFTTEIDDAADQGAIRKVFERSGGAVRNGFYHFSKADGVPHPMVHWRENSHKDKIADLTRMSLEFVERGTKAAR